MFSKIPAVWSRKNITWHQSSWIVSVWFVKPAFGFKYLNACQQALKESKNIYGRIFTHSFQLFVSLTVTHILWKALILCWNLPFIQNLIYFLFFLFSPRPVEETLVKFTVVMSIHKQKVAIATVNSLYPVPPIKQTDPRRPLPHWVDRGLRLSNEYVKQKYFACCKKKI